MAETEALKTTTSFITPTINIEEEIEQAAAPITKEQALKTQKTALLAPSTILNSQTESSTSSFAKRRISVSNEDKLSFNIGSGEFTIQRRSSSAVGIPPTAQFLLKDWLTNHTITPDKRVKNRIPYEESFIPKALSQFKDQFHCSWHEMKKNCQDPAVMQVVNDLRSAYLEELFTQLKSEFPGVQICDFGSTKLTSDRDFSFKLDAQHQAGESVVVKRANELFENKWNMPSATVFDSNAYTMQYVLTSDSPDMEQKRSGQQEKASLVMKLRTSNPESWTEFKENTLNKLTNPYVKEDKEEQFAQVEQQNKELNYLLHREMIHLAISDAKNSGSTHSEIPEAIKQFLTMDYKQVPLNTIKEFEEVANILKEKDPSLEIQASNTLHANIKSSFGALENRRVAMFSTMETLDKTTDVKEFQSLFNDILEKSIHQLQEKLELKPANSHMFASNIQQLQKSLLTEKNSEEIMQIFHEMRSLNREEKQLHTKRLDLEAKQAKFDNIESQLSTAVPNDLASKNKVYSVNQLSGFQNAVSRLHKEHRELLSEFNTKSKNEFSVKIESQIRECDKKFESIQLRKEFIKEKTSGAKVNHADVLGKEGDRLLIQMQESNLQGMFFAQEAHVSEGAFGVVVLNIQARQIDIRTPNQYAQAFREIGGFYSGHQMHKETPTDKMIEVSKYAERLFVITDQLTQRAKALGIDPPNYSVDLASIKDFFSQLAPLRGTAASKTDLETKAQTTAQNLYQTSLDSSLVDKINSGIEQISGTIEAWVSSLDFKTQNAYYKNI